MDRVERGVDCAAAFVEARLFCGAGVWASARPPDRKLKQARVNKTRLVFIVASSNCPVLDLQAGYPAESLVVCHQYHADVERMRCNQQIKWRQYLA